VSEIRLEAQSRNEFGKGASRRARREGLVPAVVYGHGTDPVHINLPGHALMLALKTPNVLFTLAIEGKDEFVLPKAVQRDPIKRSLKHIDLLLVKRGEKVTVEIQINTEGELAPGGNLLEHILNTLPLEAEATHLPESVTISIAGLEAGNSILAKDITLPQGATLAIDPEAVVLQVVSAQVEAPSETEESTEAASEG
jgi:large subunit ribosomal protein L25